MPLIHGADPGATLRLVACSNAYANSISRGSLHAVPVNPTPNGAGLALNPLGNAGVGVFGTIPNGTTMIGYPARAASPAPLAPGVRIASSRLSSRLALSVPSMPL